MTSRIDCEGGKELIAPEMIGAVFHRATAPMRLHDIEVEEGAVVVRVVAKKDFQIAEGQSWKDVLLGHVVQPGTFVNVYVLNKTAETKRFSATLVADVKEIPAEVIPAEVVPEAGGVPSVSPTPPRRPVATAPKIVTGTDGKPLMQNLPPIIGKPAPGEVAARARTFAAQNGGLGTTGRGANGGMAPLLGNTRNAAPRPGPSQTAPKLIQKSKRVVERRLPKVEHHQQSRIQAPFVSNVSNLSGAAVPIPPPNAVLGVVMPPVPDSETEGLEFEETDLSVLGGANADPELARGANDEDEARSVMFVTGHALALQRMVEFRVPIHARFKAGIVSAVSRALGPDGRAERGQGAAIDTEVRLTKADCTALLQMIARGRGTLPHPDADRLAAAFRAAFYTEQPVARVG